MIYMMALELDCFLLNYQDNVGCIFILKKQPVNNFYLLFSSHIIIHCNGVQNQPIYFHLSVYIQIKVLSMHNWHES